MIRTTISLALIAVASVLVAEVNRAVPSTWSLSLVGPALADDDGDDDRDDAKDGRSGEGAQRDRVRAKGKSRRVAPAPMVRPLPVRAADEIVVTGLSGADLTALLTDGFAVIDALSIARNGAVLHRLRVPAGLSVEDARDRVRARPTGTNADFNHYFRASQTIVPASAPQGDVVTAPRSCSHLNCRVLTQIAWPQTRPPSCQSTIEIGIIDTSVNLNHAGLLQARIEFIRLADADLPTSAETHGTAVVALLAGTEARAPGLLPEARLVAVDIFSREGGDERADVVHLVQALDLLAARKVRVVNLSLAGPQNAVLSDMLAEVDASGMLVVAATGNGGPAALPAWPAAAETVLAVTAVDGDDRIYRRAQRGPHVDVAAPGVEVWSAASAKGVKPRTGTSYAAPFATAAAAIVVSREPSLTPAAVIERLRGLTRDLGAAGADDVFGAGVLMLSGLCEDPAQ